MDKNNDFVSDIGVYLNKFENKGIGIFKCLSVSNTISIDILYEYLNIPIEVVRELLSRLIITECVVLADDINMHYNKTDAFTQWLAVNIKKEAQNVVPKRDRDRDKGVEGKD